FRGIPPLRLRSGQALAQKTRKGGAPIGVPAYRITQSIGAPGCPFFWPACPMQIVFDLTSCEITGGSTRAVFFHLTHGGVHLAATENYLSEPATQLHSDANAAAALPRLAVGVMASLCAVKVLLHIFTSVRHYGYFRDELYYLDMARHLDWGYVDAAPLIAVYAKIALLMGGSLWALRILPALAGAALIALTMVIVRELGGGRYAQFFAGLCILLCPAVLSVDSLLTMNAFEPLFWMGCIWVIARILRTGDSRLWPWFGLLAGLGLENKHSTLSFGFAVTVALLLTGHRREFARRWIWIAGAIALALFLPNIIWQIRHHFPTIEDLANVRRDGKNVVLGPLAFVKEQIIDMHPVLLPVWVSGLVWFLRDRRWRVLGLTFVVFFVLMDVAHGKNYYVFPIYPMLFAGGAVVIERWLGTRAAWTRAAVVAVIVLAALPAIPLVTWMLPPERLLAYQNAIGFKPGKAEVKMESLLPQPVADQFGWPEMVNEVAGIYNSLPLEQRAETGIWAGNYGEAGAINLFGPKLGLPRAYSRHQNHWYWGPPPQVYKNLIVIEWSLDDVRDNCTSFQAFNHYERFGMGEENTPIYLCRGVEFDIQKIWWHSHHWN
ncbi:MAG: glycosyltransferase family 39 protein, partial [Terriglobales bacterium]